MIKDKFKGVLKILLEKESDLILKKYKPRVVLVRGESGRAQTRYALETALSKFYFVRSGEEQSLTVLGFDSEARSFLEWLLVLVEGVALIVLPNHYPEWLILESEFDHADFIVEVGVFDGFVPKDYEVVYDENNLPKGITFNVESAGVDYPVYLDSVVGEAQIGPVLSAFKLSKELGEHLSIVAKAFSNIEPLKGHTSLVEGIKGSVIIDDTFDSSPNLLLMGLKTLISLDKPKRRVAVIGDMLGLDKNSIEEHKKIGQEISKDIDLLVTVGIRSRYIAEGALNNGFNESKIFQFEDSKKAGDFMQNLIAEGDTVYVSGSRGMYMEDFVEEVMAHPETIYD